MDLRVLQFISFLRLLKGDRVGSLPLQKMDFYIGQPWARAIEIDRREQDLVPYGLNQAEPTGQLEFPVT